MKSGVQMNALERRFYADRVLSELVRMVREATPATLSSREQRGVFRLEAMVIEKSGTVLYTCAPLGSRSAARWAAFSTAVLTVVHGLWQRARTLARELSRRRGGHAL